MLKPLTLWTVIFMIIGITILLALGTWQVERLNLKESLISRVKVRSSGKPVDLEEIKILLQKTGDVDYMAIKLKGRYEHDKEMYSFNIWKGEAGWNVITPFRLDDDSFVLVNRGFVPTRLRDKSSRQDGLTEGIVTITGLARSPVDEKPNFFVPNNKLNTREFFWKSYSQMISLIGNKMRIRVLDFTIDKGVGNPKGGYPIGGVTRTQFSNNHLQYAITWYSLALCLFIVGCVFLSSGRKKET